MPVLGKIRSLFVHVAPRRMRAAGLALVLSLLTVAATASPTFAWGSAAFSPADEQLLFTLTNQDRASAGLNALVNDSYLHKEAEWRAQDMGDRDYFSHTIPPSNTMVFDDMQKDHYCFKVAGENIGLSTFSDAVATTRIEKAFMGSPGHRANILGKWGRMGVGAYEAADGRKLYVVLFSVPCASKSKPAPKAPAKATPKPTPSATPTAMPTESPTAEPTATPTATLALPSPAWTPSSSSGGAGGNPSDNSNGQVSLRVRDKAPAQGPLDSLFKLFFGGLSG
jgi:uncharacterized protein YkwD